MPDNGHSIGGPQQLGTEAKGYALSGKIMLSAIVILFVVVLFMVALHIYARWYLLRVRHRNLHNRRNRRQRSAHIVFYVDTNSSNLTVPAGGLNASVLSSLPVFAYSSLTHATALECAVCLSEFEENEKGRLLPKCQHCFHIDCIDMWFQSHSTCPLCRSPVDSVQAPTNNQNDVVLSIGEPGGTDPGSSSGLGSECEQSGSTSVADRRKDLETVDESEDESRIISPAAQGFRSPGTRMLSLKRILSMNRKVPAASASGGTGTSSNSEVTESQLGGGSGRVDSVSNWGSYSSVEYGERYRHSGTVSHTI